jgi:hypothetical protein
MAVWGDHLLPLLSRNEAARLGRTCKALWEVVQQLFKDLGTLNEDTLRAALTTFPRARKVELRSNIHTWGNGEGQALKQWLREGGRGRHLETLWLEHHHDFTRDDLVPSMLQAGALPSLKRVYLYLPNEVARESLTGGFLGGIQELGLDLDSIEGPQLAALRLVRQLPVLAKLEVTFLTPYIEDPGQWPHFIPPSLQALCIYLIVTPDPENSSLLCALLGMLWTSGARLEHLELTIIHDFEVIGNGLVHLAQILRCCSPTLEQFLLWTWEGEVIRVEEEAQDYASQVERLREEWAGMLACVSACRELQVLVLPEAMIEPLFPPGTAFGRLVCLEIYDELREHPPDAGVMGLWGLMASGGLPALAKLRVVLHGRWGEVKMVKTRVAPALEAVAGTLTHLHLEKSRKGVEWLGEEVDVDYELGVALGKLWRLKDLAIGLFHDGRAYHAVAQGLAVSGGDRPLPLLWRLVLVSRVETNANQVVSLLLPSVRLFHAYCCGGQERTALLIACALRQAGYEHTLLLGRDTKTLAGIFQAVAPCRIASDDFAVQKPYWDPWYESRA